MTLINPPSYLQNRNDHTAQTDRLATGSLLIRGGVPSNLDMLVKENSPAGMSVLVSAGSCYVASQADNGYYHTYNDDDVVLNIASAHATLARKDLIIVRVRDAFFSGANNDNVYEVLTGTPSSTPADPTTTGFYVVLARVNVPAASTTVVNARIDDLRPYAATAGGAIKVRDQDDRDALELVDHRVVLRLDTNKYEIYSDDVGGWLALGVDDTGWVDVSFASGYTNNSSTPAEARVRCRRINNQVWMHGLVKKTSGTIPSGTTVDLFTLPVGFRPSNLCQFALAQSATTSNTGRLIVNTSGIVQVGLGTDANYVSMDCSFLVD